jgi:hypothetical protein
MPTLKRDDEEEQPDGATEVVKLREQYLEVYGRSVRGIHASNVD